jgi:hypothetical protein
MANLSVHLSDFYLDKLREDAASSYPTTTVTAIIQRLVKEHYDKIPQPDSSLEHVPGIKESLSEVIAAAHPETRGLIIPDMEEKPKSDPEIKEAFSLRRGNRSSTPPSTRPGPSPIKRITYE